MFGCEALFANANIYALVWKDGRIGLKIPDEKLNAQLMSLPGSDPWSPGGKMSMRRWILVPESFHDDLDALAPWVKRAHALALEAEPAKKPASKKSVR